MTFTQFAFGVQMYTNRMDVMASKTARVSARIPEGLLRELEGIMDKEGIDSMSECVRECIEEFIQLKTTRFSTKKIIVDVGEDILDDVKHLMDIGRVSNMEEAFKNAIRSWTEYNVQRYLLDREKYDKTIAKTKGKILDDKSQRQLSSYYESP